MPIASSFDVVGAAKAAGRGVAAFNVIGLEHAEALVAAADRARKPVILQISENAVAYHGMLEPLALGCLALARTSRTPVVLHLDHATDEELVARAVGLGFTSVMFDASTLDYDENVARTAYLTRRVHENGVWMEAELGEVGGKDGVHAPGVRTDPAQAAEFVAATGVDALAVAVGSSHAMTERTATLDFELIARLSAAVDVPLVLHGSSGVPDDSISRAVAAGLTKVNIATHLNAVFTAALRDYLAAHPAAVDPRKYVGAGRDALENEAFRLFEVVRA